MTDLTQLQRGLLNLMKGRPIEAHADYYLQRVAVSNELLLAKEIALWWRAFGLETYCIFTSRLLNRLGIFDQAVETFFCECSTSPFIEKLSQDFLAWMSMHKDPLVASVARFERALIKVKRGDSGIYRLDWSCNPESLLNAILQGTGFPPAEIHQIYRTTISSRIPGLVSCERVERTKASESSSRVGRAPSNTVSCMDSRHVKD